MFQHIYSHEYEMGYHHTLICRALDKVIKGETKRLIINIAPRYGKTLLVSQMFIAYGFALNPSSKFMHLSYSGGLVTQNSMAVKDIVKSEYFQDLFEARIERGFDTRAVWGTEQGGIMYATSTLGQLTGFGAGNVRYDEEDTRSEFYKKWNPNIFSGAIVIDDPIKPDDALSDAMREAVNLRFETTIRSRVNSKDTPIIVIMQRVHEHDLCGYLLECEPDQWEVLSIPCIQTDENGQEVPLWPFKHTLEDLRLIERANPIVFQTQYMQNPTPLQGLMYTAFRTYEIIPQDKSATKKCYIDTADVGYDYLCAIFYTELSDGTMYVEHVIYTKKSMEYTEPKTAEVLAIHKTDECIIESNSAGRSFMRNVEKISREIGNRRTKFTGFTQTQNKQVRIYSRSVEVTNMIFMPTNWAHEWPDFYRDVTYFRKEGRSAHDDAPDALTGMVEHIRPVVPDDIESRLASLMS